MNYDDIHNKLHAANYKIQIFVHGAILGNTYKDKLFGDPEMRRSWNRCKFTEGHSINILQNINNRGDIRMSLDIFKN